MTGPAPEVATVRLAVRGALADSTVPGQTVLVACSGGPDSLALAAATAFEAPRLGLLTGAVVVDHGLQPNSDRVAAATAEQLHALGLDPVLLRRVEVTGPGGPEAAARRARYTALRQAATETSADWVLLGHTRDDQAETVLLGLGRGSGPRSIAGMRPVDPPWLRPLLDVDRAATTRACTAEGLTPWQDPHNADRRFVRVRLRLEVLPLLEEVLGGGVAAALARTATLLRQDIDALDDQADHLVENLAHATEVSAADLAALPAALLGRVLRNWLARAGVPALTSAHLSAASALLVDWHGQGPVALPGGWQVCRRGGRLLVRRGVAPPVAGQGPDGG